MTLFKRSLYVLLALAMIAFATAVVSIRVHHDPKARGHVDSESKKKMTIQRVQVDLKVDKRGLLTVTQRIRYDLGKNAWHGLYQDIILANNEQPKTVEVARYDGGKVKPMKPGSGIQLGVGGAYGTFGAGLIKDPDRRLRIVWNVNDTGVRSFRIRYTLAGAVKNNADVSSLLWDVWGTGWESGVGVLGASATFPGKIKLFHPRTGDLLGLIRRTSVKGDTGSFELTQLPAGRQVQLQVAAAPLTGMKVNKRKALPGLRAEQKRIDRRNADLERRSAELHENKFSWFLLRALIGALLGVAIVAVSGLTFGRDPTKKVSAGGTYQYPPEKIPAPAVALRLGGASTDNLVSSALLGLLQKDVFRVLPSEVKKEDISIRNLVGEETYDRTKVEAWELPIAELLQTAIDKDPKHSPDFTKLKKFLKPTQAEAQIALFKKELGGEADRHGLKQTYRGRGLRTVIAAVALVLYVLGLSAVIGDDGGNAAQRYDSIGAMLYLFGLLPVLLWAAVEGNAFYRLRADQAERVRQWETYADFFEKMDLSREYPLTVEIWDEALLYAAAFGYATKVITNMPRTDAQGHALTTSDYRGTAWLAGNAAAIHSFKSIGSGVSGVTGMSSSSSSGGGGSGFSGGGSGGGGGGGW